ncbi:MAG TPA: cytochrome c [Terriglobales bacterium]|nr:cytochrome c [Terriglobales bacterium]
MKVRTAKWGVLTLSAVLSFSCLGWTQDDGQAIFKQKCAACHGPAGEGKIGPALKGTKLSEDDVLLMISKGNEAKKAPHKKAIAGLSDEQMKAVAHYVKSLK